jgi:hypothetical protein
MRVVHDGAWDRVWWCPGGWGPGDPRAVLMQVLEAGLWDLLGAARPHNALCGCPPTNIHLAVA